MVKEKNCENCIWEHAHRLISSSQCDRSLKRINGSAGHGNKDFSVYQGKQSDKGQGRLA